MTPLLQARDVSVSFGRTRALRGASLAIGAGEIVAISGPSGSGKSTLLHCLAGILVPDDGEIRYGETRLDELDEDSRTRLRREVFGIVFQFGGLVPELTAVENVAVSLMFGGLGRAEAAAAALDWLGRLGVDDCAPLRPGDLSGGQVQRVAMARALAHGPKVVFADEPTGALDSVAGEEVLGLLLGTARDHGTTVVLVTHDNRIAAYADREIVVRDGAVAASPVVTR
ncbi:ABC transporter ATP-binding protein [Actinomadura livida]|uniref:ABC transporter ATP-binding protein n=1 Tax=Actinomadura livida TaxID=79909 RepID=A0A7W7IJU9_9ACTN|nr:MULTISPECIES: ABC transporter ATP-binding protein [Actinomadura]MBB4778409.1 putative ABC transport system ATP-binding protein [Actinomadura catellatispora]GGU24687.1 macrolide ABC transporter ATP-binding protein [Actinomadura livida]